MSVPARPQRTPGDRELPRAASSPTVTPGCRRLALFLAATLLFASTFICNSSSVDGECLCQFNRGKPVKDHDRNDRTPPVDCREEFESYGAWLPDGLADRCSSSKGYHAVFLEAEAQYRARLIFYSEEHLAEVAQGLRKPWRVPF